MAQELVLLTEWRERLKRQSESGLTVEAFCEKEGVSTSMFYRWQRHFQNPSPAPTESEAADTAHHRGKKVSLRQACVNRIEAYGIVAPWVRLTTGSKEPRHGRVEQVKTGRDAGILGSGHPALDRQRSLRAGILQS